MQDNCILPSNELRSALNDDYDDDPLVNLMEDDIISKNISDYQDVQIFTTIFIGEKKEPFEMIFDTGSNWLWIDS